MDFLNIFIPGRWRINGEKAPIVTFVIEKISECGFKNPKPDFHYNSYVSYPPEDDPYYFFPTTITEIIGWTVDFINDDVDKDLEDMIYDLLKKVCNTTCSTTTVLVLDEETKKAKVSYEAKIDTKTNAVVIDKKVKLN